MFDECRLCMLLPAGAAGLVASLVCTSFCKVSAPIVLDPTRFGKSIDEQPITNLCFPFGILGGLSSSIIWTCSIATLGHWFSQKRARATGLATTAGAFGGIFYPLLFYVLSHRFGFPWALRCFALVAVACFTLSHLFIKTRLPRNERARILLNSREFKDSRFSVTVLAIFIIDFAVLVPPTYITTYASAHGFKSTSPYILTMHNAASILGRAIPGPIADEIGRFNVMVISSAMGSICIFSLWLNANASVSITLTFAVLHGFFSGLAYSLTAVCVAQLCRTNEYASKYGTAYGLASLGTLAGISISGMILETGSHQSLILFCGAAYASAAGLFAVARIISQG